jgi:5-methylcytosine-specific restriction endonuclease McrA
MKRSDYPPDWEEISLRIRERDGWCCYWCHAPNGEPHPATGSIVVLTVHHWNGDKHDNRDKNLAALCQRCHLSSDGDRHREKARATRLAKKLKGQLTLEL